MRNTKSDYRKSSNKPLSTFFCGISPYPKKYRAQKKIFLPGSKPSTFITFYVLSSPFPINNHILSLYLSLLLSFPSLSFLTCFLSPLSPSFHFFFLFPSSFLGNLRISATFLISEPGKNISNPCQISSQHSSI